MVARKRKTRRITKRRIASTIKKDHLKFNLHALTEDDLNGLAWLADSVTFYPPRSIDTINTWLDGSNWSENALILIRRMKEELKGKHKNFEKTVSKLSNSDEKVLQVIGRILQSAIDSREPSNRLMKLLKIKK